MATFFAQPYAFDATGFYFAFLGEYEAKASANLDNWGQRVEEYEIQMIEENMEGDAALFDLLGINQATLRLWFDEVDDLELYEKAALYFLVSHLGYRLDEAQEKIEEVTMQEGSLHEVAAALFDECYSSQIPESAQVYIDYEHFAHDCRCSGEMIDFDWAGRHWVCTNVYSL